VRSVGPRPRKRGKKSSYPKGDWDEAKRGNHVTWSKGRRPPYLKGSPKQAMTGHLKKKARGGGGALEASYHFGVRHSQDFQGKQGRTYIAWRRTSKDTEAFGGRTRIQLFSRCSKGKRGARTGIQTLLNTGKTPKRIERVRKSRRLPCGGD